MVQVPRDAPDEGMKPEGGARRRGDDLRAGVPSLHVGQLMLKDDHRRLALFDRMAERSGIAHRYSFLEPGAQGAAVDAEGFYKLGAFPDTAARMKKYEACAPALA